MFTHLVIFILNIGILTVAKGSQDCVESYPNNWEGKYNGTKNTSVTGKICKLWEDTDYPQYGIKNYCRAPQNEKDSPLGPWCYVNHPRRWERCFVPICNKDCRNNITDKNYYGTLNVTISGYHCRKWSLTSDLPAGGPPPSYHNESLNYCRTPSGDIKTTPWCYINNKEKRLESCNVSLCSDIRATICPDLVGSELLTEPSILTGHQYGSVVTFGCKNGYKIQGPSAIRCTVDAQQSIKGHWNETQPECVGVDCRFVSLQHSNIHNLTNKRFPFQIQVSCEFGHHLNGPSIIQCTESGNWSKTPTCDAILCPELQFSELFINPSNFTGYKYYSVVTFKCKNGYYIKGHPALRCMIDLQNKSVANWNETQPVCEGIPCSPVSIKHSDIQDISNKRFSDVIPVTCDSGYKLNGTSSIQCTESGKWTNLPTCVDSYSSEQSTGPGAAIGGGTTAAIIAIVIIIVVIIFTKRRRPKSKNEDQSNKSKNDTNEYSEIKLSGIELVEDEHRHPPAITDSSNDRTYSNELKEDGGYYDFSEGPQISKSAIPVKDFCNYVGTGRCKGGKLEDEFLKFKTGLQYPTNAALKPRNKIKNKYKHLFPYDETRVVLKTTKELMSDYINASYINGYGKLKQYIASQGPQDNTVNDFWQMVWQVNCCKIVMLTNVFEEAKQKCNHYWPENVGKSNDFDGIVITLTKEDIYSDFTIRHIKMQKERAKTTVIQFHFTAWPDKDVPKYSSSLVHFRHKVNSTESSPKGPVIVHCSAGIGRTGTFIALDFAVTEANEVGYVDVFRCVETLRRQRVNMVQTARQYVFLHDAVLEALVCPYSGIPTNDFPDVYKDLMKFDSVKKKHKLGVEYDLLTSIPQKHDEDDFEKGKNAENRKKNRYSNIIPVESEMPRLISSVEGHNEYINAIFLPGYKSRRAFVVTQMPMENTVIDFWRLVFDYNISVIVMLNTDYEQTDVYWPKQKDKNLVLGPFEIKQKKLARANHYLMMEISITSKYEQKRVTLFQQMFWNDKKTVPNNIGDLFSFITDIEEAHRRESGEGPLLVHCLNGCDKSGLYCVISTVIEKLRIEQDVDIQHTIKQMRNRRPQIISNYEQYRFLYEAVLDYLKQFETYANFS